VTWTFANACASVFHWHTPDSKDVRSSEIFSKQVVDVSSGASLFLWMTTQLPAASTTSWANAVPDISNNRKINRFRTITPLVN
jgi:hypothetical protein